MINLLYCECNIFLITTISCVLTMGLSMFIKDDHKYLSKQLNFNQQQKYKKIKNERLRHYLIGLVVSSLLGLLIYSNITSKKSSLCIFGLIIFIFSPIIYYFLPKSDYMLKHLTTEQQKMAWLNISRNYTKNKILSYAGAVAIYYLLVTNYF